MRVMLETDQQVGAEPDKRVLVKSIVRNGVCRVGVSGNRSR